MEYTKGEWKVEHGSFLVRNHHTMVNDNEGSTIAEVYGDTKEQAEANAHLIAAAPKLYEALKGIFLVATPVGYSEYIFEKQYFGKFEVHGNRLETALRALAEAEDK